MRGSAFLLAGVVSVLHAQADWPGYGRDKGAQRYSPLSQVNTENVSKLVPAWTFSMQR
jgi:glucose dehydrogenase